MFLPKTDKYKLPESSQRKITLIAKDGEFIIEQTLPDRAKKLQTVQYNGFTFRPTLQANVYRSEATKAEIELTEKIEKQEIREAQRKAKRRRF